MSIRLKVQDLSVKFETKEIIKNISFEIPQKEIFCLIGESGSGKTTIMNAIMQKLSNNLKMTGLIHVNGKKFIQRTKKEKIDYYGKEIGVIFQKPEQSLHPNLTIEKQFEYFFKSHTNYNKKERELEALLLLEKVKLRNPKKVLKSYPRELSGGMNQRVSIALAIALKPSLLIADEPTTALDNSVQIEVISLLKELCDAENMSMLFITHDISLATFIGDYVGVMKDGILLEQNKTDKILQQPQMEYTKMLFEMITFL